MENKKVPTIRFKGFSDDWVQRKFTRTLDFPVSNNSLSRSQLNYEEGKVMNIHYGDILINYGSILEIKEDRIPFISGGNIEKYRINMLKNGDVVFADAAEDETVGKAVEINGVEEEVIVSGLHTIVARPKEKMAKYFLGHYINSEKYHRQLIRLMQGSKVSSISKNSLKTTIIKYPIDLEEQSKIGIFFNTIDKLVDLYQRKIKLLELMKKEYLNCMFPKREANIPRLRFAGFTNPWEQRKLNQLFNRINEKGANDLDFVTVLFNDTIIRSDAHQGYGNSRDSIAKKNAKIIRKNNFLIDLTSYNRGFFMANKDGLTSSAYTILENKNEIYYSYWKEFFTTHNFVESLKKFTPPGARQGKMIEVNEVLNINYLVASIDEQKQIGLFFETLDKTIALHQRKLEQLHNTKNEYLKRMFV